MNISELQDLAHSFEAYLKTLGYDDASFETITITNTEYWFRFYLNDIFQDDLPYADRFHSGFYTFEATLNNFQAQDIWDQLKKVPTREIRELTVLAMSTAGTVAMKKQLQSVKAQHFVDDIISTRNILRIAS